MIIIIVTMNIKGFVMMSVLERMLAELQDLKKQQKQIVVRYQGQDIPVVQSYEYTNLPVLLRMFADIIEGGEKDVKA